MVTKFLKSSKMSFWHGNENIPSEKTRERITHEEYENRVKEILKCKNDIIYFAEKYFWIIHPDKGKHIINLYKKQKQLLRLLVSNRRVVCVASRQCGKTTSYTIYSLWLTMFHSDKKIVIAANKKSTALEILARIRFAYELLPIWIKTPIRGSYNKSYIEFTNMSSIDGESTSSNSARGKTGSVLIVDEAARIPHNLLKEFWLSVSPIISSGNTTKCILVSTPNGVSGLFYEKYLNAKDPENVNTSIDDWCRYRIDWWDVPGRDEKWKQEQLHTMSEEEFAQEYGNSFLTTSMPCVIPQDKIERYRRILESEYYFKPEPIIIKTNTDEFTFKQWFEPRKDRTYLISADGAEGLKLDYSIVKVWDVTDTHNIILCASFSNNTIDPKDFTFVLYSIAEYYHYPYIAIENNGITKSIVNMLESEPFLYENFITISNTPQKHGISSNNFLKNKACVWLNSFIRQPDRNIWIFDKELIDEMPFFVQKGMKRHLSFAAVKGQHDDHMITFIWMLLCMHPDYCEQYFKIIEDTTKIDGTKEPKFLGQHNSTESTNIDEQLIIKHSVVEEYEYQNEVPTLQNSQELQEIEKNLQSVSEIIQDIQINTPPSITKVEKISNINTQQHLQDILKNRQYQTDERQKQLKQQRESEIWYTTTPDGQMIPDNDNEEDIGLGFFSNISINL